jgi:hypothetical protein
MTGLTEVELEIESLNNVILAAENWSKQYKKDPDTHAAIIKVESRLETVLRRYFKELSERAPSYINWFAYESMRRQIAAADDFNVDVIINDAAFGKEDSIFIQTVFDPVAQAVALGANAGEKIYSVDLGLSETHATVQKTAKKLTAELVGKRIDADGNIVDNPKASYRITDKARADIRQSISTSLSLGEDQATATQRLLKTIKDPKRAGTIARTEAVNGYQRGLLAMGDESGAVGKEWQSVNQDDICGTNARAGIIKIKDNFPSGHSGPAAHPNCRCGLVLIYPEDPRVADIGKGPVELPPEYDLKGNDLSIPMKSGKVAQFKLSDPELQFINDSKLNIRSSFVKGRTQGHYTPSTHTLTIANPDPEVFYHELGHAIDYKMINNKTILSKSQAAVALDAEKQEILLGRLKGSLGTTRSFDDDELIKYISGSRAKFITKDGNIRYATMDRGYRSYINKKSELFAEAYRQYRLLPSSFAKSAPEITKIFKELGL